MQTLYRIRRETSLVGPIRYVVATAMDVVLGKVEGRWGVPWRETYRIDDPSGRTIGVIRKRGIWLSLLRWVLGAALAVLFLIAAFTSAFLVRAPLSCQLVALDLLSALFLYSVLRSLLPSSYGVEVPVGVKALSFGERRVMPGWRVTREVEGVLSPEAERLVLPAVIAFSVGKALQANSSGGG